MNEHQKVEGNYRKTRKNRIEAKNQNFAFQLKKTVLLPAQKDFTTKHLWSSPEKINEIPGDETMKKNLKYRMKTEILSFCCRISNRYLCSTYKAYIVFAVDAFRLYRKKIVSRIFWIQT